MQVNKIPWSTDSICLRPAAMDAHAMATVVYERTCRTNFDQPGFCVLNLGGELDSVAFRRLMVDLKTELAKIHSFRTGETLIYLSAARFDQQESTKPHLDGGPDQCFLMLGYEPSEIASVLEITDYAKCAFDLGLSPVEFMDKHNPMFKSGEDVLRPYVTRIPCFSPNNYQIFCINNSTAPYSANATTWQGTLHTAMVLTPDESKRRVINSTMIARAPVGSRDLLDELALDHFIHTPEVKGHGYNNRHLENDQ